jgi:hypothetical protein
MNIVLGTKEYELKGVTIDQYKKVKESEGDLTHSQYISLLTGIDLKEVRKATVQQIGFVSKVLNNYYNNSTTKSNVRPLIEYKGQMYGLAKPSTMTWGQWTDLEVLTSQQDFDLKHLSAVLYQPCEKYNLETQDYTTVQYDYDESVERSKDMGDFLVKDILSSIVFFLSYANSLISKQKDSMEIKKKEMESVRLMKEHTKKN